MSTRKKRATRAAVLVLGMHRSGTSAVARCLNLMGLSLGDPDTLMPPSESQPRGYWEQAPLTKRNDELLAALGSSWYSPAPPEASELLWKDMAVDRKTDRALLATTFPGRESWVWKDPRLSLTLPYWRRLLAGRRRGFVIVEREPLEVARSLTHPPYAMPICSSLVLCGAYRAAIEAHLDGVSPVLRIQHADLVHAPAVVLLDLDSWLRTDLGMGPMEAMEADAIDEAIASIDCRPEPTHSIVILCHGQWAVTQRCLTRLLAVTRPSAEVIVVDNGSEDETPERLAALDDRRVRPVRLEENVGVIRAKNLALGLARAPYLISIDNDCVVSAGWLGKLCEPLERDPEIAQVGRGGGYRTLSAEGVGIRGDRLDYVDGSCFAIRTEVAREVGLCDEAFDFAYCEDADLSLRLRKAGWQITTVSAGVRHTEHATARRMDLGRYWEKNHELLRKRWGGYARTGKFGHDGEPDPVARTEQREETR